MAKNVIFVTAVERLPCDGDRWTQSEGAGRAVRRASGVRPVAGAPEEPVSVNVFTLIMGRRSIAGSAIGGIAETQAVLDFCTAHGFGAEIEVIGADQINDSPPAPNPDSLRNRLPRHTPVAMKGVLGFPPWNHIKFREFPQSQGHMRKIRSRFCSPSCPLCEKHTDGGQGDADHGDVEAVEEQHQTEHGEDGPQAGGPAGGGSLSRHMSRQVGRLGAEEPVGRGPDRGRRRAARSAW
ncbi:hypothetical protein ACFY6U_11855 [Streptomyces sp. NPDC013157]|uniref:hypothetical protein n=1 Tax=Streptomyces sp. NPDC013157 TaxID=3364861 RepID=UPI0036A81424